MAPREHVPTVRELAARGMAWEQVDRGTTGRAQTYWRITPEGQALIYAIMERNGRRAREWSSSAARAAG